MSLNNFTLFLIVGNPVLGSEKIGSALIYFLQSTLFNFTYTFSSHFIDILTGSFTVFIEKLTAVLLINDWLPGFKIRYLIYSC